MKDLGDRIADAAMQWIGTPHVNGAKVKGKGVDCGMLLIAALEDAGAINPGEIKVKPYSNQWHLSHGEEWFLHYVQKYCDRVHVPRRGDFLLYQYGRCISHGAVYVGDDTVCHAYVDTGVILSSTNDSMFIGPFGRPRLRGIYRFNPAKREKV